MGVREKGYPKQAFPIEKIKIFQNIEGSEKQKTCQITVCCTVSLIKKQDEQGQKQAR